MLDYRINTFLCLCETMNYRKTAEKLNMTQPAVTQHIQHIENQYGVKLFSYNGKTLAKTEQCTILEAQARAAVRIERDTTQLLGEKKQQPLSVGATKTIGEYVILKHLQNYVQSTDADFNLTIDNTDVLLRMLDHSKIDFALIEGTFSKKKYGSILIRREDFVGICSDMHPFAGKTVDINKAFSENLILRESGSGTRTIFEKELTGRGWSTDMFRKRICVNNFGVIINFLREGTGISFGYKSIAENQGLSAFYLKDIEMSHEFNYVFLRGTGTETKIAAFESAAD